MANLYLKPHQAPWHRTILPSYNDVMRWVTCDRSGHWFWRESRGEDRHRRRSHDGFPIWAWKPSSRICYKRGILVVARVLIHHASGSIAPRTRFLSLCGLSQCVRPDHWSRVDRLPSHTLVQTMSGWRLCRVSDGGPVRQPELLPVACDGGVHRVTFGALTYAALEAVCGRTMLPQQVIVLAKDAQVSCEGCR